MAVSSGYAIGEVLDCTNVPCEEALNRRFYKLVPKDLEGNLIFRQKVERRCLSDSQFRRGILQICKDDVLFWINTFCWVFEPRPDDNLPSTWIPFITWNMQDTAILAIEKYLGRREIGIEKSRAQGASWIVLMVYLHQWIFSGETLAFGLVSRNEALVNNEDDPDSLFWKIDNQLDWMPTWMTPWFDKRRDRTISKNVLKNPITKATFTGSAATKDPFVGGRKTGLLWDEFAKFPQNSQEQAMAGSQHSSRGRIILSTPMGNHDVFFRIMDQPSSMLKMRMHWSNNPVHGAGLYRVDGKGGVEKLDPNFDYRGYQFVKNPKIGSNLRSPWYDAECVRPGAVREAIARELDIDYSGAAYKWYGDIPQRLMEKCRKPDVYGNLSHEDGEAQFVRQPYGSLAVWGTLDSEGYLPESHYVVACDVAVGTGSDESNNSALVAFDRDTGIQVAEWARHDLYPDRFAMFALAVCRWLARGRPQALSTHVQLTWDSVAIGGIFSNIATAASPRPLLFRRRKKEDAGKKMKEKRFGWSDKSPEYLHGAFRAAIDEGQMTVLSQALLAECTGWEWINGKVVYVPSVTTKIASSMGTNHGDRVSAGAMAWQAVKDWRRPIRRGVVVLEKAALGPGWDPQHPEQLGHTGTLQHRLDLRRESMVAAKELWDLAPEEGAA